MGSRPLSCPPSSSREPLDRDKGTFARHDSSARFKVSLTFVDIGDARQVEEALRQSERKLALSGGSCLPIPELSGVLQFGVYSFTAPVMAET